MRTLIKIIMFLLFFISIIGTVIFGYDMSVWIATIIILLQLELNSTKQ